MLVNLLFCPLVINGFAMTHSGIDIRYGYVNGKVCVAVKPVIPSFIYYFTTFYCIDPYFIFVNFSDNQVHLSQSHNNRCMLE